MLRTSKFAPPPQRHTARLALTLFSMILVGCSDVARSVAPDVDALGAKPPSGGGGGGGGKKGGTTTVPVPAFVFVSNESGVEQLYRFRNDTITRLTFSNWTDRDPHSAAGKLVFTSYRDGNAEIYLAGNDGSNVVRLTSSPSLDEQAALHPAASRIAFVSARSGTPRLWAMNADGSDQVALVTGSPSYVPERAPAWSPTGDRLAFTSTRTGTSQVWMMPAAGGVPVQITFESGGAFDPVWSADGTAVLYTTSYGMMVLRSVNVSTGEVMTYASGGADLGQPSCGASMCLVVSGAYGSAGDVVAYTAAGSQPKAVVTRSGNDVHPAVLVP